MTDRDRETLPKARNIASEYLVALGRIAELEKEIERQRDAIAVLPGRWELALAKRWSSRWKALARFRGWPASRHERNRRRLRQLDEENERLRAEIASCQGPQWHRAWKESEALVEAALAEIAAHLTDKEKLREAWKVPVARIEAALILLPEQPEAAMNVLRGEGVSDGSG